MTKAQAGRLGGIATHKKHGSTHMSTIGKRGAETTWTKYQLIPAGTSQYAMVEKSTNKVIAIF